MQTLEGRRSNAPATDTATTTANPSHREPAAAGAALGSAAAGGGADAGDATLVERHAAGVFRFVRSLGASRELAAAAGR